MIDFDAIRRRFSLREQIARYGSKVGRDGRFRCVIPGHRDKNPSASITMVKGAEHWRCHACDKGGDVIDLVAAVEGCTVAEAARRLTGEGPREAPGRPPEDEEGLGLVFDLAAIPDGVEPLRGGTETPPILSKRGKASTVVPADAYLYRSADGTKVGYVLRIQAADGSKKTLPVRWERTRGWVWAGWTGTESPPLLNAPELKRRSDTPVVILEGEKCVRVAYEVLRERFVVTCWQGGTAAVKKADFSLLRGREVIFWPDADEVGKKAMRVAAEKAWAGRSRWVEPSPDWPEGHDIADVIAEEGVEAALDRIRSAELFTPVKATPELPPPGSWLRVSQGGWVPEQGYIDLTKEATLNTRSELNAFTALEHHPAFAAVSWDVIRRCVMNGQTPIAAGRDIRELQVRLAAETQVRLGIDAFGKLLSDVAMTRPVNPLADKLRALTWDGIRRPLPGYAGVKETPWSLAAFDRWFLGVIARILDPGCQHDLTLVLEGEQGPKKTSFLRALASPCGFDGYTEMPHLALASNDLMQLDGKLIVELGEMTAYRKADLESFKAALTSRVDRYRRPYAATFIDVPRTCCFCGTTNMLSGYLTDPTGNRRFVPVRCVYEAQVADLERDLDQIYAEAIVRYTALKKAKVEVNWFSPEEIELQRSVTARRELPSVLADKLDEKLQDNLAVTIDPETVWNWLGLVSMRDRKPFQAELIEEMRRRGWVKTKGTTREDRRHLWRRLNPPS